MATIIWHFSCVVSNCFNSSHKKLRPLEQKGLSFPFQRSWIVDEFSCISGKSCPSSLYPFPSKISSISSFFMWCFDSGKISCILFFLSTGNRLVITLWELVSSHQPLEESVCLLLDFFHCITRKTYLLFLHPWQRFMHILQIFQLLGKILLFIFL